MAIRVCGVTTMTKYKIVEVNTVTDEELEEVINATVKEGWIFDGINFAMRDASKRPAMAFVIFTKAVKE